MKLLAITILALSVFISACDDPAANKARAVTSNSTSANTSTANTNPAAKGGTVLQITPENSDILFTGSKVTGKHDGGFNKFNGTIDLVNEKPEDSTVSVTIETASIFSDADGLTKHLQTADFFDVQTYPKASFTSMKIVPDTAKGANNYTVTGDLELRSQKKSVTFPATITVTPAEVNVNTEFSINRKDFGMAYTGKADDLIRDDVVIKLDLKTDRNK